MDIILFYLQIIGVVIHSVTGKDREAYPVLETREIKLQNYGPQVNTTALGY